MNKQIFKTTSLTLSKKIVKPLFTVLILLTFTTIFAENIIIDCTKKYQKIDGIGITTEVANWQGIMALKYDCYDKYDPVDVNKIIDFYANDLKVSIVRVVIRPSLLSWTVEDWKDISYKNLRFTGDWLLYKRLALQMGVDIYKKNPKEIKVIGTVYSAPYWMKEGQHHLSGYVNTKKKFYAKFLAEWVKFMEYKYKTPVYALSPFADNTKPPCGRPHHWSRFTVKYGDEENLSALGNVHNEVGDMFKKENLKTLLMGPEIGILHKIGKKTTQRVPEFVNIILKATKDKNYLNILAVHGDKYLPSPEIFTDVKTKVNLSTKAPIWVTHAYGEFSAWEGDDIVKVLNIKEKKTKKKKKGKKGKKGKVKKDKSNGTPSALYLAIKMHNSFVHLNASAYVYGYITSQIQGTKSLQVRIADSASLMHSDKPTKKAFVFKHFSRFIRPNSYRVNVVTDSKVMTSAYLHKENKTLTVVLINKGTASLSYPINIKGVSVKTMQYFLTTGDEKENCKQYKDLNVSNENINLPPLSVTTLYGKY